MCHFGTAAWKTADGSGEEHKYTETSPEEQNRWGGALIYNYVPRPTSVVNSNNIWTLIYQTYTSAWPYTRRFGPTQTSEPIQKVKSWPRLIQEDFATDLSGTRTFAMCCFHGMTVYSKNLTVLCVATMPTAVFPLHFCLRDSSEG